MKEMLLKKSTIKVDPKRDDTPNKGGDMMQQLSQIVEIKEIEQTPRKDAPSQEKDEEEPKASGFSKTMKPDQDNINAGGDLRE